MDGMNATKAPEKPQITLDEAVEAFHQEIVHLRTEVYRLSERLRRYDRMFETAFKEELDRRVNGKSDCAGEASCVSPLSRLRMRIQQERG
jgi:hypothetical protein